MSAPVPANDLPSNLVPTSDLPDQPGAPKTNLGLSPETGRPVFAPDPGEPPTTTPAGIAGAITRGAAPYAAGAGVGGLIGGPPGALVGAGAVGLTQIATSLYNKIAPQLGWRAAATPQEATDKLLDYAGVKRPSTETERVVEATTGGAANALTGAGAAKLIAEKAASPVTKAVAERLAEKPVLQAASGALGGAAGQATADAGFGPGAQFAASFLGSITPYGASGFRAAVQINPKQAAADAINAGYVLPPAEATEGSVGKVNLANAMAGFSGKVKTRQYASASNQPVTNRLAATDLGLPPDTTLTPEAFDGVRREAGKDYAVLKSAPSVTLDKDYRDAVAGIGAEAKAASKEFPNIIDVGKVDDLKKELLAEPVRSTLGMVEVVKRLRFDAKANLQARDSPDKLVLGLAQRQAANEVDDLIERNLAATGNADLVAKYKAARTRIAKSYDYETATNGSTNDVDARKLGGLLDKGRPLTGNMKLIADSANHFPHAFQPEAKIGGVETFSVLDWAYGAAAATAAASRGEFGLAAALASGVPFLRPAVRAAVMSGPVQRAMVNDKPNVVPLPIWTQPGLFAVSPSQNAAQSLGAQ